MRHFRFFVLIISALTFVSSLQAGTPQRIPYQGMLVDNVGDPVADGAHLVKFIVYNAAAGGIDLWNSGFQNLTTVSGLFSYELGSVVVLPDDLFTDTSRYLGITVGVDAEMTPRTRFSTSAYAYQALRADSSDHSAASDLLGSLGPGDVALSSHTHSADITGVGAGSGLSGGGTSGFVTLNVATDGIASFHILDGTVQQSDLSFTPGDITGVGAGSGLSGGGTAGSVTLNVATSGITSTHILNGTVQQADLSFTPGDITAVTASGGSGLNGGGTSGSVSLSVDPTDFNGSNPALDARNAGTASSTGSDVTITSATISAPVSGRVVAIAKSEARCSGCATDASGYMTLSTSSSGSASSGAYAFSEIAFDGYSTFVCMETFSVGAGTTTVYLRGRRVTTGGGTDIDFIRGQIQLIFIPN